jgi:methyl coenzyme M reductase subunit D
MRLPFCMSVYSGIFIKKTNTITIELYFYFESSHMELKIL